MADRWQVTACTDPTGTVWTAVGDEAWQGPDGTVHDNLHALERAVGECAPTAVHRVDLLVAEAEASGARVALLVRRNDALTVAVMRARRALLGSPTRCDNHPDGFRPAALCCARPRDVDAALAAITAALPAPG